MIAFAPWSASLGTPLLLEVADKMLPFGDRVGISGLYVMSAFLLSAWCRPLGALSLAFAALLLVEDAAFARSPLAVDVSRELGSTYLHWDAIQAAGIVLATFAGSKLGTWRANLGRANPGCDGVSSPNG